MKKIFNLVLVFIMLLTCMVNAANIGDVINKTVYTDIVAKINGTDIASYNIDGYTVVVAEDLRNYGFNVTWVENERALYIEKNPQANSVTSKYVAPFVPKTQVGKKANDVLYSDIKTYMEGNLVTSYNIGGQTVVYFNDLSRYGGISYDDKARVLSVVLPWLSNKSVPVTDNTPPAATTSSALEKVIGVIKAKGEYDSDGNDYSLYDEMELDDGDLRFLATYNPGDYVGISVGIENYDGSSAVHILIEEDGTLLVAGLVVEFDDGTELTINYNYNSYGGLVLRDSKYASVDESARKIILTAYNLADVFFELHGMGITLKDLGIKY